LFCGRRADTESLKTIYELEAWLQEFGWYRNQPKPTMKWLVIKDVVMLQSLREEIIQKLRILAQLLGFRLEPLLASISILRQPEISQHLRPIISITTNPEVKMP
jgi:hypothetical protein